MAFSDFEIADPFIALDDTTTDADEFMNVKDLQVFAKNHNALLANLAPSTVCSFDVAGQNALAYAPSVTEDDTKTAIYVFQSFVLIRPWVQSITLEVTAHVSSFGSGDSNVYPVLHPFGRPKPPLREHKMAFSATSIATAQTRTASIEIPQEPPINSIAGSGLYVLGAVAENNMVTDGDTSVGTISGYSKYHAEFSGTNMTTYLDYALVCDTNTLIEPRLITKAWNQGCLIDSPWTVKPENNVDTFSVYQCRAVRLLHVSAYENVITSFSRKATNNLRL